MIIQKKNIITECTNYSDNTLLDSTEFNENNPIYISFDKSRPCTCGKIHEMKGLSKIIGEQEEKKDKNYKRNWKEKTKKIKKCTKKN